MHLSNSSGAIEHSRQGRSKLHFTKRAVIAPVTGGRQLGVFPASFNPVTIAHVELVRRASVEYGLDEVLVLAGTSNADKDQYECSLDDRLRMLHLALDPMDHVSIAVCSAPFFVDMIEPITEEYPAEMQLSFILGIDTFVRVLDPNGKYVKRYRRQFADSNGALDYLLSNSTLIVADRRYPDRPDMGELLSSQTNAGLNRIQFMDFPADFSERSATEVRSAVRAGVGIGGLVPESVEEYIHNKALYSR